MVSRNAKDSFRLRRQIRHKKRMEEVNKDTNQQRTYNFLKEIRCAVLDTSSTIGDEDVSTYMRQLTYNFLRNNYSHYKYKIYEDSSVDNVLNEICDSDPLENEVTLVVFQAYGNCLYDTWKPLEQGYSLFREYCNFEWRDKADNNEFLLMGHILDDRDKDRWFRLHEQCFVINYKMWKQMGKPKFGNFDRKKIEVNKAVRSESNFHDSHTPHYLDPGIGTETIVKQGFGWNMINESLKAGIRVLNFDEQVRSTKTYLYPEIKEEQEEFKKYFREDCAKFLIHEAKTLGEVKKEFLHYQCYTVRRSPTAAWIMNTESVNDVIFVPRKLPLKNLYSVAAGFKTYAFLNNWNKDTNLDDVNIHYFDISQPGLDVRKWFHKEWEPRNFDMYLDYLYEEWYKTDKALLSIYEDFEFESDNWSSERVRAKEAFMNSVLRIFDTMEEFYVMHDRLKEKEITYAKADLTKDYSSLLDAVKPNEEGYDSVIWSSNYITTRYTTWLLSYEERKDVYRKVMSDLNDINPHLRVHSADWDGTPTRGMKVEELNHAYGYPEELFKKWRHKRV